MSSSNIKAEIIGIIRNRIDLTTFRAFFFGSRVTGKARERSDFDVGIYGEAPVDDETMRLIRADMDNMRTLYKIDVIDFANTKPDFREVAMKNIEEIPAEPITNSSK